MDFFVLGKKIRLDDTDESRYLFLVFLSFSSSPFSKGRDLVFLYFWGETL